MEVVAGVDWSAAGVVAWVGCSMAVVIDRSVGTLVAWIDGAGTVVVTGVDRLVATVVEVKLKAATEAEVSDTLEVGQVTVRERKTRFGHTLRFK